MIHSHWLAFANCYYHTKRKAKNQWVFMIIIISISIYSVFVIPMPRQNLRWLFYFIGDFIEISYEIKIKQTNRFLIKQLVCFS